MSQQTDLETLCAMFDLAGVSYLLSPASPSADLQAHQILTVQEGAGPKNLGYYGFYTDFSFADDGRLLAVGCWE